MNLEGQIQLSDFGVSARVRPGKKRTTFVGSPCWMAPEVMEQETGYDYPADIWSLGITAIELSDAEAPYSDLPAMTVLLRVINSPSPVLKKEKNWSNEFKAFVNDCLQKDPELRPKAIDLLTNHKKFFDKAKN